MSETCHKAQEIDLALFLLEPQGSEWQAFRAHYPYCATCSAELQRWTVLEQHLRSQGELRVAAHPSADALVQFQRQVHLLAADERAIIEAHVRSCAACREEVKLLGSFDSSLVQQWAGQTKPAVTAPEHDSWSVRFWDTLRSVFFHPAFAYGLLLLLAVPFIRSYYTSSHTPVPISSDIAASEKAKEDTAPAKLAKQSAQREDLALKDEQSAKPSPTPAAPTPSIPQEAGARNRKTPAQSQSPSMEEKERQAAAQPPIATSAAEGRTGSPEMLAARKRNLEARAARSTEGDPSQQERVEEGASFSSPVTNASRQVGALARGNAASQESEFLTALSSLTETYKNAYEARDLNALGQVWNVDLAWREALRKLFTQSRQISLSLTLNQEKLTASADQRQVSVPLSQTITAVQHNGQMATHGPFFCIADLRKQNTGAWRIHDLQEDPQHPGQCRMQ
jgi:hypothetical protein